MKIPTPDAYLIEVADRAMTYAQRRGYRLPGILGGLLLTALVGAGAELAVCIAFGRPDAVVLAVVIFLLLASTYVPSCAIYRRHGAAWTPSLAKTYFVMAINERMSPSALRLRLLELITGAGFFTGMFAFLDLRDWSKALLFMAPMIVTAACSIAQSYGACAMPVEPDAEARTKSLPEMAMDVG